MSNKITEEQVTRAIGACQTLPYQWEPDGVFMNEILGESWLVDAPSYVQQAWGNPNLTRPQLLESLRRWRDALLATSALGDSPAHLRARREALGWSLEDADAALRAEESRREKRNRSISEVINDLQRLSSEVYERGETNYAEIIDTAVDKLLRESGEVFDDSPPEPDTLRLRIRVGITAYGDYAAVGVPQKRQERWGYTSVDSAVHDLLGLQQVVAWHWIEADVPRPVAVDETVKGKVVS